MITIEDSYCELDVAVVPHIDQHVALYSNTSEIRLTGGSAFSIYCIVIVTSFLLLIHKQSLKPKLTSHFSNIRLLIHTDLYIWKCSFIFSKNVWGQYIFFSLKKLILWFSKHWKMYWFSFFSLIKKVSRFPQKY